MTKSDLLIKLRNLHEELAVINDDLKHEQKIDEKTIDALGEVVTDVSRLVDFAKDNLHIDTEEHKDVVDRIVEFQSDHPQVTRFLSQVTDMLAMMGI